MAQSNGMDHPNALPLIGAGAAVVAGACLAVKSAVILATGWQPPVLFEVAIPAMAVAAVLLAWTTAGGTSIKSARALGVVATIAGIVAVATEVAGSPLGPAIALSTLATLATLLIVGLRSRPGSRLGFDSARQVALGIVIAMVLTVVVGGLLSALNERLLEVPLLGVGVLWLWFARVTWTSRLPRPGHAEVPGAATG